MRCASLELYRYRSRDAAAVRLVSVPTPGIWKWILREAESAGIPRAVRTAEFFRIPAGEAGPELRGRQFHSHTAPDAAPRPNHPPLPAHPDVRPYAVGV